MDVVYDDAAPNEPVLFAGGTCGRHDDSKRTWDGLFPWHVSMVAMRGTMCAVTWRDGE